MRGDDLDIFTLDEWALFDWCGWIPPEAEAWRRWMARLPVADPLPPPREIDWNRVCAILRGEAP